MREMTTVIKRVVVEEVSNRVTQLDAVFEGITNSIHAKATHVICRLTTDQPVLTSPDGSEIAPRKVECIEIEDNGEGFNDQNYRSFGRYRTDLKVDLGCKGVGRFIFLKLFDDVHYTSQIAKTSTKRSFTFSCDFDSDNIEEVADEVHANRTVLSLKGVTDKFFTKDKTLDRRLDLDLNHVRQEVLNHLIPTLFFCARFDRHVTIELVDVMTGESVMISDGDVPSFESLPFDVGTAEQQTVKFILHHAVKDQAGPLDAFYCANHRSVCQFADKDLRPRGFSGCLLLESQYLDDRVNDNRNDFDIFPVRTDVFSPLSWEMINAQLKKVLSSLIRVTIPDVDKRNAVQLREIQDERPYLIQYIEDEDLRVAGFVSKRDIVEKAKKRFDAAKEKLLLHAQKEEYTDEDLEEAIQVAQNELVAYIQDRVLVVRQLKSMLKDKEQSEQLIHNLFMERFTEDENRDHFNTKRNNLWLIDDRFTNYSYAASEKRIQHILQQTGSDNDGDRPDLALFFSQDPANTRGLKAVIVELKSFKDEGKSDREKYEGIQQLIDYIRAFQKKESIEEVWAFLVTDVDPKLADRLVTNKFTRLFSTDTPIYHQYYDNLRTSIHVIGVKSLIMDAEARNKVFIDIIKKQSRLSEFLNPTTGQSPAERV